MRYKGFAWNRGWGGVGFPPDLMFFSGIMGEQQASITLTKSEMALLKQAGALPMALSSNPASRQHRPEFMVRLGLAPPYSVEDVKTAYRDLAKIAHPDHGGSAHDFQNLHEAFERAQQYLAHRSDRRKWIAGQMESYLGFQRLMDDLEELGAEVTSNAIDWLEKSFGDFALLTEAVTSVRLENSTEAEKLIRLLIDQRSLLGELTRLELPGCPVSDDAILSLKPLEHLHHLDLTDTPITPKALAIVEAIPSLNSMELKGTEVGWWGRQKIANVMRRRKQAKPTTTFLAR